MATSSPIIAMNGVLPFGWSDGCDFRSSSDPQFATRIPRNNFKVTLEEKSGSGLMKRRTWRESTVRYLGIDVDDALAIAEQATFELSGQSRPSLPIARVSR
jgi:hypothetical protein